jgi:hypothetical protein
VPGPKKAPVDQKIVKTKNAAARVCKKPARGGPQKRHEGDDDIVDVDDGEDDDRDFDISEPPAVAFVEQDLLLLQA